MSPRRALPLIFVLFLVTILGTGCYTVLQHPEAEPLSSTYSQGGDRWDRDYYSAGPGLFYGWTDPYYTSLYGGFPPAWGYYYYHPWTATGPWWCDPWYPWNPWDPSSGTPPPGTSPVSDGRHAWDRGRGAPSPGVGMPSVPGTPRTPGVSGTPATPAAPPSTPPTPAPDTTTRTDRKPAPERKKGAPPPSAWGR
jgi:hypothetical protein